MEFQHGQKVKIIKDHNGKDLKRPIYGYVVWCEDASKSVDAYYTEQGRTTSGNVFTVQTSWSGGALWYTPAALRPAGGINRWNEWQKKLQDYHEKHKT